LFRISAKKKFQVPDWESWSCPVARVQECTMVGASLAAETSVIEERRLKPAAG